MGAPVDGERRKAAAQGRLGGGPGIIDWDSEHGTGGRLTVPVVVVPVGDGAQRITDGAVGPLRLGAVVVAVRRADDSDGARANALQVG